MQPELYADVSNHTKQHFIRLTLLLQIDVAADKAIFERLGQCSAVQAASSEEQPEIVSLPGKGYTVVFDP